MSRGELVNCACGCGAQLQDRDEKNRPRRFLRGHHTRLDNPGFRAIAALPKSQPGDHWRADGTHWRTARWRARQLLDASACTWSTIGGCKGPIEIAHVDGDYTNGDESNLLALCASHHRLLDNGRIDPTAPQMPRFRVGKDGKRRYEYAS